MIVFIDNYDSFTYNLVDYFGQLSEDLQVFRNDCCTVEEIALLEPQGIVLSPGPGTPDQAGICKQIVQQLGAQIPILGVCLGHQCIGEVYGAEVVRAGKPVHGKTSKIYHNHHPLFENLPNPFNATRYHSLIINRQNLPENLKVIAETEDQIIMAVAHRRHPVIGVQFHPEAILTDHGFRIIANWFRLIQQKQDVVKI